VPTLPARPTGLSATNITQTSLTLNWLDNSNNESGFTIQVATNNTFTTIVLTIADTGSNATSYNIAGLTRNTRYYFRVRAFNIAGFSPWSPTFNVRTLP
jgi:hypothetical protein